jgi:hypothetical protein
VQRFKVRPGLGLARCSSRLIAMPGIAGRHRPKSASRAVARRRGRPYEIHRFNCIKNHDFALDHADERPLNQVPL